MLKFKKCGDCGVTIVDEGVVVGACQCGYSTSDDAPYIIGSKPSFNRGLGCVTNNARHAERIARSRGLVPIGDTPIEQLHKEKKENYRPILEEGIKAAKAGKTLEGKPLKLEKKK